MRRYEIEAAVDRAQLPGPSTGIMRALLARINARAGIIEPAHQPSLSQLAALSGYSRSTIQRHLNDLEAGGWVIRIRPPMWLARTRHVTTAYAMRVPPGYPQARRRGEPRLGALREDARRAAESELGARDEMARRAAQHTTEDQTDETEVTDSAEAPGGDLELLARTELEALAGRPVSAGTAAAAVRLVLAGRAPQHPAAYLLAALREDPRRYLPGPSGPRQFRDGKFTS
jgi:DNA-binding transcriptional ArsR family regulator